MVYLCGLFGRVLISQGLEFIIFLCLLKHRWNTLNKYKNFTTKEELLNEVKKVIKELKEEVNSDAIEFAEKNIGTSDRPIDGPSYIKKVNQFFTEEEVIYIPKIQKLSLQAECLWILIQQFRL